MRFDLQRIVADFDKPSTNTRFRFGEVQSTEVGSVTVTVGGSTTQVAGILYLKSYTPTVGDTVMMVTDGEDLVILGAIV